MSEHLIETLKGAEEDLLRAGRLSSRLMREAWKGEDRLTMLAIHEIVTKQSLALNKIRRAIRALEVLQ